MSLRIFNTMSRKKEKLDVKKVKMFVCGPTVYDYSHLGHARTYIAYDIIAKYLRYKKIDLFFLMNITDIDDKIINRAKEMKIDPLELSKKFEKDFYEDMRTLGINSINTFARASDYIQEIIVQVKRLMEKGFAYQTENGIYYDITKFKDYGKLSHQNLEELKKHRIEPDPTKRNPQDFALWKKEKTGEISWNSQWGKGRPGWHIEDTAIAEKFLGQQYDIHGGGIDLIFPHHEAEIAQMESVSGKKPFVRYWMHTGFVKVNKDKMSKSLDNFLTIKDVLKNYNKEVIRFLFLSTHYRKPIDFNQDLLEQAKNTLQKLNEFMICLENYKSEVKDNNKIDKLIDKTKKNFEKEMNNDFDTHNGITVIFEFMKEVNKMMTEKSISNNDAKQAIKFMREIDKVFGILEEKSEIPNNIKKLAEERQEARKKKDFKTSDKIRDELKKSGYYVDDKEEGYVVKRL